MSSAAPIVEIKDVERQLESGLRLRIKRARLEPRDRLALFGFDRLAAEAFVHLLTGALLPDRGDVLIAGRNTREISTDAEWLQSLDRFGLVTERAVLLEAMSVAANLALPLTLAVDPLSAEMRARVGALAQEVGLTDDQLSGPVHQLTPADRLRAHLARALAAGPAALLLEHPTRELAPANASAFGETLARVSESRGLAWIALTADEAFTHASGARKLILDAKSGALDEGRRWTRLFRK
jgi:ABC-type lipoprotein export system ATPase subunit